MIDVTDGGIKTEKQSQIRKTITNVTVDRKTKARKICSSRYHSLLVVG